MHGKDRLETFRVFVVKSNGPVLSALNNWSLASIQQQQCHLYDELIGIWI